MSVPLCRVCPTDEDSQASADQNSGASQCPPSPRMGSGFPAGPRAHRGQTMLTRIATRLPCCRTQRELRSAASTTSTYEAPKAGGFVSAGATPARASMISTSVARARAAPRPRRPSPMSTNGSQSKNRHTFCHMVDLVVATGSLLELLPDELRRLRPRRVGVRVMTHSHTMTSSPISSRSFRPDGSVV